MLEIPFKKYQGTGNDFIVVDNRKLFFPNTDFSFIKLLCDRQFGIGADGLMLLQNHQEVDFEMKYYNADGKPGSLCGNGGRCIVAFAKSLNLIKNETKFLAVDGIHTAKISDGIVSLAMNDVNELIETELGYQLNTGSPHLVIKVNDIQNLNVFEEGKRIRNLPEYILEGINVNFIDEYESNFEIRTYERGVENETLSCGTGVTAAILVLAHIKKMNGNNRLTIKTIGGELSVSFNANQLSNAFTNIELIGPAIHVFSGVVGYSY